MAEPGDMPATVARVLDRALADDPDREALVTRSQRLSYAELDRLADRAAHALADLGVGTGDRVAASLPNEADVVVAFHGAMRLGAVWVGVNRALAPPEKRWQLADCGASLLLSDEPLDDAGVTVLDTDGWRAALDAADDGPVGVEVDPYAPAGIAYTSGTTGRPKGAVHSQHNLLLPGAVLVATRGYGPELRKGDCFPFTILNLAVLTTLLVSQAGGTSIVMDRIDAEGVAEWI
ncbi:MAG: AMP-binding protein, partial [Acidimicrobiales bacterium]|nr:AMP-binding protein [Acidimicrobiales bacterium]